MSDYSNYVGVERRDLVGWFSRYEHKSLERKTLKSGRVLEIGGGKGDHLPFCDLASVSSYTILDLFVPDLLSEHVNKKINFVKASVEALPFEDETFERVIMTCVLHHLRDPEKALQEVRRVLVDGGQFSLLLPHDPGHLYRIAWNLLSRNFRRTWDGVDPRLGHAKSHLLSGLSLRVIIEEVFRRDEVTVTRLPFRLGGWHFSVSSVWQILKR